MRKPNWVNNIFFIKVLIMHRKVLLISEDAIKEQSSLNNNLFGKNIAPSIVYAQEMGLVPIIGECLYDKICELVYDGSISDELFVAYKDLLDIYIQPYLLNKTICEIIPSVNYKIANLGAVVSNDEHVVNLSQKDIDLLITTYQERADFYTKRLQDFIKNNASAFPEIACGCGNMQPNLESSENSVGLWLGGSRGKKINDNKCGCSSTGITCGDYQSGFTDGVEFQKRKLQITAVTENGRYISEDGFKEIAVDVQATGHTDEELQEAYQDGVVDGTDMQKARLSAITLTQNGDYTREDGYSAVTVNVAQSGHTDEEMAEQYQSGYTDGSHDGYQEGYGDGFDSGATAGIESGKTQQKALLSAITISQNGNYTRENGYSAVTVNVSGQEPSLVSTAVTANGNYFPSQGYDGFSSFNVNVPQTGHTDEEMAQQFQSGKTAGIAEQKAKLSAITITQNGNYNRIDGYSAVTVNVAQSGYSEGYQSGYTDGYNDAYNLLGSIEVSPSYNNIHYNDTAITLTAVSNIPWAISSYPEWAVPNVQSGSGTTTINVSLPVNTGDERRGNIVFDSLSGSISSSVYIRQGYQPQTPTLTGITLNNITWETDMPASGGTANKNNCSYVVTGNYSDSSTGDVTTLASVSGSSAVPSSQVIDRHSAGTITLTATYSGFTATGSTGIYQSGLTSLTGLSDYLTFEIKSSGTIKWVADGTAIDPKTIEYRKNSGSWTEMRSQGESTAPSISVASGDVIEFRGDNTDYGTRNMYSQFKTGVSFKVKGNIMSLVNSTNYRYVRTLSQNYNFRNMFSKCTGLTDASKLVLPASGLTEGCYEYMFDGCTSLTTAPDLLVYNLRSGCYNFMFSGCTNLTYIKCLAEGGSGAVSSWVDGVPANGTFVKHPNSTWVTGKNGIPTNWTVNTHS